MKHCDCRRVESPADFVTSPDTLRTLADDHRLCEMPAKFRWSMQRAAAEIARLCLTGEEREAVKLASDFLEDEFYGCSDKCAVEHAAVATLRKLLERTK